MALEAESDVGVDAGGDADVGMAQQLEEFAFAEAGARGEFVQRVEPVGAADGQGGQAPGAQEVVGGRSGRS